MGDEDFEDEEGDEFEDEEGDEFEDEEDPEIELDENIVKKFRALVRESINEMFGDKEEPIDDEEDPGMEDEKVDAEDALNEAKAAKMNSIVESVVNDILNEDELHEPLSLRRMSKDYP